MRRLAPAICTAALIAGAASTVAATPPAGEVTYVAPGAELDWVAVRAPLPTEQLGAIAARAAERVRAAAGAGEVPAQPALLGEVPATAPGEGWASRALPGASRGRAPLGARRTDGRCACATPIGDERVERVAALHAQVVFHAGDEVDRVRVLELRARFADGMVAYLNGVELARRGIDRRLPAMGTAARVRGPEWETFYAPAAGLLRRGENRLAIEVRPHQQGRSPSLDLALVARGGPRIVRGPIVQWRGGGAAAITFDTDLPVRSTVELAVGGGAPVARPASGGALAVRHRVELASLPPSTPIRYRAIAGGDASPQHLLHTPPGPGDPVRFAVYGDMRGGHRTHARIVQAILDEAPSFVVVTGDLVLRGTDEGDWQKFFEVAGELLGRVPFFPAVGNHDMGRSGDEERRMNEIFGLPDTSPPRPEWAHWYSVTVAGVHLVMLDSNSYQHEAQLEWLEADLAAARRAGVRAIFAATHDGPYSRGPHGGNRFARERYVPVLVKHGVSVLFTGHDHLYQRGEKDGLRYVVSGGAGAPLYPVKCGTRGRPRCGEGDGAAIATSEHHYLVVTVRRSDVEMCARRPDRTPVEKCQTFPLR